MIGGSLIPSNGVILDSLAADLTAATEAAKVYEHAHNFDIVKLHVHAAQSSLFTNNTQDLVMIPAIYVCRFILSTRPGTARPSLHNLPAAGILIKSSLHVLFRLGIARIALRD